MPDPDFRERLRLHHADLSAQMRDVEPGSLEWFDFEKAMAATARLYARRFREAIQPLHNGPHPE